MGWNYLSIHKLQRLRRWSLGTDKWIHPTLHNGCNYLSMPGSKLIRVGKKGPLSVASATELDNCAVLRLLCMLTEKRNCAREMELPFSQIPTKLYNFSWQHSLTSNGSWCMGIKGESTVCVTFTWDMYIYICVVYSLCLFFCLFITVTWWYVWCIEWQPRGSTGMFGNLMAIYHIMLQFIKKHSRYVMLMIWK